MTEVDTPFLVTLDAASALQVSTDQLKHLRELHLGKLYQQLRAKKTGRRRSIIQEILT